MTVTVRSTASEPTIPITDATIGPGTHCPLGIPLGSWYTGDDGDTLIRPYLIYDYYPINTSDFTPYAAYFANGFDTDESFALEAHSNNGGTFVRLRNQYIYFECTAGWDASSSVRLTLDGDSEIGTGFEVRWATVPPTRNNASGFHVGGYLYAFEGAPHYLFDGSPEGDISGPSVYVVPETGDVIADEATLTLGGSILISGPLAGKAILLRTKDRDPSSLSSGTQYFADVLIEVVH